MCLENAVIHLQSHKEDQTAVAGIQEKQYNEGGKMNNRHRKEKKQRTQYESRINRRYKDSLFRKVFSDKKDLLDLYNALNGTDYSNEEELTVTTLGDVVYISVKNDLSFLVGGTINLYEHQSSYNPNMPVRGLMYFARL